MVYQWTRLHILPLSVLLFLDVAQAVPARMGYGNALYRHLSSRVLPATQPSEFWLLSWNLKYFGRDRFNYGVTGQILAKGDLIILQEVGSGGSGRAALGKIARLLTGILDEPVCAAVSEQPSGARLRYGFLWRDKKLVAFTKPDVQIADCTRQVAVVPLVDKHHAAIRREPAVLTFSIRKTQELFKVASVHLRPQKALAAREIAKVVHALDGVAIPFVIAGDFNLTAGDKAFGPMRLAGFQPVFFGVKTTLKRSERTLHKARDNIWFRGITLRSSAVVDLYSALPELPRNHIYNFLSDHVPVLACFRLQPTGQF